MPYLYKAKPAEKIKQFDAVVGVNALGTTYTYDRGPDEPGLPSRNYDDRLEETIYYSSGNLPGQFSDKNLPVDIG